MIGEWFRDALTHYGHRRIDSYRSLRGCWRLGVEPILRRLKEREYLDHVIRFEASSEVIRQCSEIKKSIEYTECSFGEWTSFKCENDIVFVFRHADDAVRFRLMWDD
jgi:hypothetical protein